jgi:hypothetical protein
MEVSGITAWSAISGDGAVPGSLNPKQPNVVAWLRRLGFGRIRRTQEPALGVKLCKGYESKCSRTKPVTSFATATLSSSLSTPHKLFWLANGVFVPYRHL